MWSHFFSDGGFGMYPTALFGFLLITVSILWMIRPERRAGSLVAALFVGTIGSGVLGTATGLINTFRYLQHVPLAEQVAIGAQGGAESLNNLVLAMLLVVPSALMVAIAALRSAAARSASASAST